MPIPDFVLALRAAIGTEPLWLSGVTAVVLRGDDVLMVRRCDDGAWTPVTGIIDPGEQPADAAVREVAEEAGVSAVPTRLVMVSVTDPVVYDNGDRTQYLDLTFRLDWTGGDPHPLDGENTEARWFPADRLPPVAPAIGARIEAARRNAPEAVFLMTDDRGALTRLPAGT